uniref:THUMP domain-containing protein n=1 Tax=Steinernema glaseri TaxID=37863 RepID=A0A1I7XWI5_9BILA
MSVVSAAHRLHAAVNTARHGSVGEIEEEDPDKTILDPEICDKVLKFIETCDTHTNDERKDEGIVKPSGSRQKIVYHLWPFSDLFNSMLREWGRNPAISLNANFYVERVPDSDQKCSEDIDKLLIEFLTFNLTRPTERSDWCIIESPLPSEEAFHNLLENVFFKTTLSAEEIRRKRPKNGRRQTRFVIKDHRAVMSLHDTRDMLHQVCERLGLMITDNAVFMTRIVGQRTERHKYSMQSFINGQIERACWIDCCDYMSTFRIHLTNDSTVNTVNIYYYLEHIDDVHPQFSIVFEHMLHFPTVAFKLERNVEMEFDPYSSRL